MFVGVCVLCVCWIGVCGEKAGDAADSVGGLLLLVRAGLVSLISARAD